MTDLTARERELVALGAALGSHCIGCIEHHIPVARRAGLADAQISEAIELAERIRQVPAGKALEAARRMLGQAPACEPAGGCCG
jgi:4-carboxymuconolactone decarboxylase